MSFRDWQDYKGYTIQVRQMRSGMYRGIVYTEDMGRIVLTTKGDSGRHGQAMQLAKQMVDELHNEN